MRTDQKQKVLPAYRHSSIRRNESSGSAIIKIVETSSKCSAENLGCSVSMMPSCSLSHSLFPTTHAWLKYAARSFHPMKTRFCPAEISYFWCQARKTVLCGFRLVPRIKYRDNSSPGNANPLPSHHNARFWACSNGEQQAAIDCQYFLTNFSLISH